MTSGWDVYLPGESEPVSLDEYADYIAAVVAYGSDIEEHALPAEFFYNNPITGSTYSIGCACDKKAGLARGQIGKEWRPSWLKE